MTFYNNTSSSLKSFFIPMGIKKIKKKWQKITYQAVGMFKKSRKNILLLTRNSTKTYRI